MTSVRLMMSKTRQRTIPTINPEATVLDALRKLALFNVGALLVIQNKEILGILSERDYARKIALEGRQSPLTLVQDVMSKKVVYVELDNTIEECLFVMVEKGIRHLPVLDNGELIDFLSMGDVVKNIVDGKDFLINQLTQYITGSQTCQNNFLLASLSANNNLKQINI